MGDYLLLIDGSSLLSTQYFGNLPREILYAKKQEEKKAWYHKIMMTRREFIQMAYLASLDTCLK